VYHGSSLGQTRPGKVCSGVPVEAVSSMSGRVSVSSKTSDWINAFDLGCCRRVKKTTMPM
jgi:hypothetical protein